MTFKELKHEIKEQQKALAQQITNGKSGRKPKNRSARNMSDYKILEHNQWKYRHIHIMYCHFFNNTPYDLIEQPRPGNEAMPWKLEELKKQWEDKIDEALRNCA